MLKVIQLMKEDKDIKDLIGANIYANHTEYLGDCLIYNYHTLLYDKASKHIRFQVTIIAESMEKTLKLEEAIARLLVTLGDEPLANDIMQVKQNGGGFLEDIERKKHHRIMYFDIIMR